MKRAFLLNVKQCNIPYSLETVDCFERAFSICLNSIKPGYANIFLLLNAYDKCSGFSNKHVDDVFMRKINFIRYYMNIEVQKIIIRKNIIPTLEDFLTKNFPVIVPINLKYLFYSDKYLEEDWPHPFVIKGFDHKKKIFYILDYTQLKSDQIQENDFSIDYDSLVQVFESYFFNINDYESPFILVFKDNKLKNFLNDIVIFKDFMQNIDIEKMQYKELKILREENSSELYEHKTNILNYPKYKDLMFALIYQYLTLLNIDIDIDEFENLKSKLVNLWFIIVRCSFKNLLKGVGGSLEDSKIKEVELMEKNLWVKLCNLLINNNINTLNSQSLPLSIVKFENNNDGIINKKSNKYFFTFSGEKLYNSWFADKSPKVVILNSSKFSLTTNVEVSINSSETYFVAGIFIRDFDNLYYFGLDSSRRINLDKANKVSSIKETITNVSKLSLEVKFSNHLCKLYYIIDETKKIFHQFSTESDTIECGIGCKTYESPKPMVATFEILRSSNH